jgi:hypothetical protein
MGIDWREYQENCAAFFRSLGLSAEVEKSVQGARALHAVDIFISGKLHGVELMWIAECKAWKTNIPKEKALALLTIVQDIGADKGILLSEVGFQSGAIHAVKNTNIMLTSLDDLRVQANETLAETVIARLHWRYTRIEARLRELDKDIPVYTGEGEEIKGHYVPHMVKLFAIEDALADALRGRYPTIYAIGPNHQRGLLPDDRLWAHSFDEVVAHADRLLTEVERDVDQLERADDTNINDGEAAGTGVANPPRGFCTSRALSRGLRAQRNSPRCAKFCWFILRRKTCATSQTTASVAKFNSCAADRP